MTKYKCIVCGYIYDPEVGDRTSTHNCPGYLLILWSDDMDDLLPHSGHFYKELLCKGSRRCSPFQIKRPVVIAGRGRGTIEAQQMGPRIGDADLRKHVEDVVASVYDNSGLPEELGLFSLQRMFVLVVVGVGIEGLVGDVQVTPSV